MLKATISSIIWGSNRSRKLTSAKNHPLKRKSASVRLQSTKDQQTDLVLFQFPHLSTELIQLMMNLIHQAARWLVRVPDGRSSLSFLTGLTSIPPKPKMSHRVPIKIHHSTKICRSLTLKFSHLRAKKRFQLLRTIGRYRGPECSHFQSKIFQRQLHRCLQK